MSYLQQVRYLLGVTYTQNTTEKKSELTFYFRNKKNLFLLKKI